MTFVWTYPATITRVIDGDTLEGHVQFAADREEHDMNIRVEGINAIEPRAAFGQEALAAAQRIIGPLPAQVVLVHHKREKYGRFLSRITLSDGRDFSTLMLLEKASDGVTPLAVPYLT